MTIENYTIDTTEGSLNITSMYADTVDRIVLATPLIGSTAAKQISGLRQLIRNGSMLVSFDYSGHTPELDTKFSISQSMKDCQYVLEHIEDLARQRQLPLHVVAACYGTLPMSRALEKTLDSEVVSSFINLNGLPYLNRLLSLEGLQPHLAKEGLEYEFSNPDVDFFTLNYTKLAQAFANYLRQVFPELADIIDDTAFGQLPFAKFDLKQTTEDFRTYALQKISIPTRIPTMFIMGRQDRTLQLELPAAVKSYMTHVRDLHPNPEYLLLDVNHYLVGPERELGLRIIADFMAAHEVGR